MDGAALALRLFLRYNEIAQYWILKIADLRGNVLLDSVPVLTGGNALANLLSQFIYLEIGSIFIVNASSVPLDRPNNVDLGTDFQMIWGDTPSELEVLA